MCGDAGWSVVSKRPRGKHSENSESGSARDGILREKSHSDSLHLNLIARAPEFGLAKLPIEWIPTSNVKDAKNARIGDIEMAMKAKRLLLYSKMKGYDLLVQQLLKFPNLKFDDRADPLGPPGRGTHTLAGTI